MAITAVFEFPNDPVEKYEKVFEVGGSQILEQPGRIHHVCFRTETGFTVVDVWADEESFAAFGQVIGPATQKAGLDAKPMVYPVQGMISQDGNRSR
jgi:heme-degrading monooxygenase HmoA